MAKTKDRLYDTADTMKPYVDRALHDDDLHDNLKEAFKCCAGGLRRAARQPQPLRHRDARGDGQGHPGQPEEGRRRAPRRANRIQGKEDHSGRNTVLLLLGIIIGVLFNPMTGPQTRSWLMEKVTGEGSDDYTYTPPASTNSPGDSAALASSRLRAWRRRPGRPGR